MRRIDPAPFVHGLIGGVLAGGMVALWFLTVDLTAGEPFRTPRVLARAVLGNVASLPDNRVVLTYTFLHFGSFALLGAAIALLIRALAIRPGLLVGVVLGVGILDSVYYGVLLTTGAHLEQVLPGVHVIAANVLGGMTLMAYLHYATHASNPLGLGYLREHPVMADALATGLAGATAVALWLFFVDILVGTPFFTAAALGSVAFMGARTPEEVQITAGIVAAYTLLHVAAFIFVGFVLVWLARRLERMPDMWLMAFMAFVILDGVVFLFLGQLGGWIFGRLSWWVVGAANLLAAAVMAGWVWRAHPQLRHQLMEVPVETKL